MGVLQNNGQKKVLYIRSGPYEVDYHNYNVQEIGLGKAFLNRGYDFDIVYYTKGEDDEEVLKSTGDNCLRVLHRKGIRLLRSGIYPQVLKKFFLSQYDIVIVSEFSQIMSYMVSKRHQRVYLYNGIYYNLFFLPFLSPLYDFLYTKSIDTNIKSIFVKSVLAKQYMEEKGYHNIHVVGVGLDIDRFKGQLDISSETKELMEYMQGHDCLLYVGALSERKNFSFMVKVFNLLHQKYKRLKFICIGKGNKDYISKSLSYATEDTIADIRHIERLDNDQLRFVYPNAKAFLLPSKQEIFGMVLLEAMYLGSPVVSSINGGSLTLIPDTQYGQVVRNFDEKKWAEAVEKYLDDDNYRQKVIKAARSRIESEFVWERIADKFLQQIEK